MGKFQVVWRLLQPGQRWAIVIGLPINFAMQAAFSYLTGFIHCKPIEVVLLFGSMLFIPWVYAAGIGTYLAAFIQILFYHNKDEGS